tara:strand:- start:1258 stop:1512 length:255 start_codon:yes stop_codon:yes gene_type:complete
MIKTPAKERQRALKSVERCMIDLEEEDKRKFLFTLVGFVSVRHRELLLEVAEATDLLEKLREMDAVDAKLRAAEERMQERANNS